MSLEQDLKRLNAEMEARHKEILEQASPELRAKLHEATKRPKLAQTGLTLKDAANAAQNAVRELDAARAKAELAVAELNKVKERSKISAWVAALVIGAFVVFFIYAAATHS